MLKFYKSFAFLLGGIAGLRQCLFVAVVTVDHTHLLAIFNAPTPEVILGSDILKLTPSHIMAHTYCLDENQWKEIIKPVQPSTFIGPPKSCERSNGRVEEYYLNHYHNTGYSAPAYYQPIYQNSSWGTYYY
ncbi:cupin domain-containing protein [Neobacillus driksii]|uniref:hypothetical protein n=1 Tax=Neobacillus driksii TaxID=3035913 RepID=UPI0035BC41F8